MKVRIVKAWSTSAWYYKEIGKEFEVLEFNKELYQVGGEKFIMQEDCVILQNEITYDPIAKCLADKAPPLGIKPAKLVAEVRIIEIAEAIVRYTKGGLTVPYNWIDELQDQITIREVYKV